VSVNQDKFKMTKEDFEIIFSNVMHLLPIHNIIFDELGKLLKKPSSEQTIGALFNRMAHFFKLYNTYCQGYENALLKLKECTDKVSLYPYFLFFFFKYCLYKSFFLQRIQN
jgi:hypothetical protein